MKEQETFHSSKRSPKLRTSSLFSISSTNVQPNIMTSQQTDFIPGEISSQFVKNTGTHKLNELNCACVH